MSTQDLFCQLQLHAAGNRSKALISTMLLLLLLSLELQLAQLRDRHSGFPCPVSLLHLLRNALLQDLHKSMKNASGCSFIHQM